MKRIAILALAFAPACLPTSPDRDGVWRAGTADLTTEKYSPAGGAVNGAVFVLGGPSGEGDGNFHRYNPVTNSWNVRTLLNGTYWFAATVLDGTLYACGTDQALTSTTCFSFDPATNAWTEIATQGTYRGGFALAGFDGRLYLSGGTPGAQVVSVLDLATGNWSVLPLMLRRMERHAMVESGSRLYLFGSDLNNDPTVDVFDFLDNTWHEAGLMPADFLRGKISAAVLNGRIYLAGDPVAKASGGFSSEMHVFDPGSEIWSSVGRVPTPRAHACVISDSEQVYVLAGFDPSAPSNPVTTMEVFVP